MLFLRSLVFNVAFYLWTALLLVVLIPTLVFRHEPFILYIAGLWGRGMLVLLKAICGTTYEFRGLDNVTPGAALVAAKHQSAWETMALIQLFPRPAYVLKRELLFIPLFGSALKNSGQIAVHRGKGGQVLTSMTEGAKRAHGEGRQIMIFPEGTRRAVGAPPDYRYGIIHLYKELRVPVTPVAINAGLFWPRRKFLRYPGTVILEVLPQIDPGLPPEDFARLLQDRIENATDRLVFEGRAASGADLPT